MAVTQRTIQGRYLLRPGKELNEIVGGCLGRALDLYPVGLVGLSVLSNHFHLLLHTDSTERLSRFVGHFTTNLSMEVKRLHDWDATVFPNRFHHAVVSEEEAAQVERLAYLLAQGVKEGLVARAIDWPGIHCAQELLDGEPLRGRWRDRTGESRKRRGAGPVDEIWQEFEIPFSRLPCWEHLSEEEYRRRVGDLIDQVQRDARQEPGCEGRRVLGAKAVRRLDPHSRPQQEPPRRPPPRFHAASPKVRKELQEAFRIVVTAYRNASARLRAGDRTVQFPEGCFPPALPYQRPLRARAP